MFLLAIPPLKKDRNVTILRTNNSVSRDVTFHEEEAFFKQPYLQGENLREDKEINHEILALPILEFACILRLT